MKCADIHAQQKMQFDCAARQRSADSSDEVLFCQRLISRLQHTVTIHDAYRDRIGSVDIASIGNVCDEVTLLSQRLKAATGGIPILAHLSPHHQLF